MSPTTVPHLARLIQNMPPPPVALWTDESLSRDQALRLACYWVGETPATICSSSRFRSVAIRRYLVIFVLRIRAASLLAMGLRSRATAYGMAGLGRLLKRDHSTIINAWRIVWPVVQDCSPALAALYRDFADQAD